jgi:hypothetical protein
MATLACWKPPPLVVIDADNVAGLTQVLISKKHDDGLQAILGTMWVPEHS